MSERAAVTGYKVVRDDYTDCYSGRVRYAVGETATVDADERKTVDCGRGLHWAHTPEAAIGYRGEHWPVRLLRVEGVPIYQGDDKMRGASLYVHEERPVAECFGPNGQGVVNLLNGLSTYRWFAPEGDPRDEITVLVGEHLARLAPYGAVPARVRFVSDWSAAESAAWSAAWSAAESAAWSVVSDLMPGADPWQPLLDIFRLGAWPIGQVDAEFVVFVPEEDGR